MLSDTRPAKLFITVRAQTCVPRDPAEQPETTRYVNDGISASAQSRADLAFQYPCCLTVTLRPSSSSYTCVMLPACASPLQYMTVTEVHPAYGLPGALQLKTP